MPAVFGRRIEPTNRLSLILLSEEVCATSRIQSISRRMGRNPASRATSQSASTFCAGTNWVRCVTHITSLLHHQSAEVLAILDAILLRANHLLAGLLSHGCYGNPGR